jgi:hypothetical protein
MYETGTATGVNDLLAKLRDFCEANGWTRDSDVTEGTGKRWHAHRGAVYINFRSFVAETPSSNVANATVGVANSIAFNVGTGYSGASAWYNQAGVPQGTSSKYMTAGITRTSAAIPTYHFFAHNSGDNVIAVIEYESGKYQFLAFGTLTKFGTYTGGQYFVGSRSGVDNTAFGGNGLIPRVGFFDAESNSSTDSPAFINATVDAEAGWKWSRKTQTNRPTSSIRHIFDNLARYAAMNSIQPNTVNDLFVYLPVVATVYRDTSNNDASSFRSPLGELPKVFYTKISTLVPGQQATLGSTNYRVFPFYIKDSSEATPTSVGTNGHSSFWGFAVEE